MIADLFLHLLLLRDRCFASVGVARGPGSGTLLSGASDSARQAEFSCAPETISLGLCIARPAGNLRDREPIERAAAAKLYNSV